MPWLDRDICGGSTAGNSLAVHPATGLQETASGNSRKTKTICVVWLATRRARKTPGVPS